MCYVDSMNIVKKFFFFELLYDNLWLLINKIIDSFYIWNYKDFGCRDKYDLVKLKEFLLDINIMAVE